ncbi:MAG: glycosyltransferase family protein [Nitrospiria bacterium]
MDLVLFLIDSSSEGTPRNVERFSRLIEMTLKTEIQEINLVSKREFKTEAPFLNQIPEKVFHQKKGVFNKIVPEKLKKNHIQTQDFELCSLLTFLGKNLKKPAFFFFEDEPDPLTHDGSHSLLKFARVSNEKECSILAIKRISFSEIGGFNLLKGSLVAEGEYRINSAFRANNPLQSSSNLALIKRFILRPAFFKMLPAENKLENSFIDTLDLFVRIEPVYGLLPFTPLKIR